MKKIYILFLVCFSFLAKAQNITVNTLLDDASPGTLRWAINQANSDTNLSIIDFDPNLTGTITLTSNLPNISADLTILGSGREKIAISGNNSYLMFWVNPGLKFNLSSLTLKNSGFIDDFQAGTLLHANSATIIANDLLITENSGYYYTIYSKNEGSLVSFTNSLFTNNSTNIFGSDYGNTPTTTEPDQNYSNRIEVKGSTFTKNSGAMFETQRFVKIDSCTFSENSGMVGYLMGLNRYQVLNSSFVNNTSWALFYFYSDLANGWGSSTFSDNHHLFDSNIFSGNTNTVIYPGSLEEQKKTTIINNTFSNNGLNWTENPKVISNNYLDDFITSAKHDLDKSVVVLTMSKPFYANPNRTGSLDLTDFQFELTGGNATLGSTVPTSIATSDSTITLGLQINGFTSGDEVLKVLPVANSIFDANNNIALTIQKNNTLNLSYLDQDGDSVADFLDQCPDTPKNLFVDDKGCQDTSFGVILGGNYITFTKSENSNYQLPANQDYITKDVILTRGWSRGLFNIAKESRFRRETSPAGTLWAKVTNDSLTTKQIKALKFVPWEEAFQRNPPNQVGETFMVYLPLEKIYFYVKMLSWSVGGGGFSYERTGCQSAIIDSFSPTTGEAGTRITIKGTNFEDVSTVLIGGTPADSFTIDSPTQITAIVAPGSEGKIALWGKCKVESLSEFIYDYKTPIITNFYPKEAGLNERIVIEGSNFLAATKVKLGGMDVQYFNIESDNKIVAHVSIGATGSVGVSNPRKTGFLSGFTFLPQANKASISGLNTINNISKNINTVIDSTITVVSDGIISAAKIQITGGFVGGNLGDSLVYQGNLPDGFNLAYDSSKGILSIYGNGSSNVWQSVLRKIAIKTTNSICYPEQRLVSFNLGDKLFNPYTKHWYEYLPYSSTWLSSKYIASSRTYFGKVGYLSTVTSQLENNFIWKFLANNDTWLGGSDNFEQINLALGRSVFSNNADAEGKYYWVTGPESGTQFTEGNTPQVTKLPNQYSNWADYEPNDLGGESYLHYYSGSGGLWNDLRNNAYLGTLVEYGGLNGDDDTSVLNFTRELKVAGSNTGSILGGGVSVCIGANSTELTLQGNSGSIVRWEYSYDNFYTNGIPISNTSSSYTASNLNETTFYRVIIDCNGTETYTNSVVVYVDKIISGNIKAENSTVCLGGNIKLSLSGTQGEVIKWQVSGDLNIWSDISNTGINLNLPANVQGTFYYRAVVKSISCGTEIYTPHYPISVQAGQAPLGGTVNNKDYVTNGGKSGLLTLTGYTGQVLKWQSSINGGLIWNDIIQTSDSLRYDYLTDKTDFRAVVTSGTCGIAYSNTIKVNFVPNSAAYNMSLSSTSIDENSDIGSILSLITSVDTDENDVHRYSLVPGKGATNNSSFEIVGDRLTTKEKFDFEKKKTYFIRLRSTDALNATYEYPFVISVLNVNEAPTAIVLSNNKTDENTAVGTVLANLSTIDPDANSTHTYTLVSGLGDSNNSSFEILGNQLKIKDNLDFEKDSTYSVRIRTTDAGSLSFEDTFTILVKNVNEAPTAISVSADSINENSAIGTVLASLSSTDEDAYDKHIYTLVSGSSDADNGKFEIVGNELKVKEVFDFEKKSSYSIRIRTTDAGSLSFEDSFVIAVKDVNEAPTAITLSANSIDENASIGAVLARLSSTDIDANDTHSYTLVAGLGDTNNASFEIVGNELKVKEVFDFEKKSSYSVRIRTTDVGSLSYESSFSITIKDINEAPTKLALSKQNIYEENSIDDLIGLFSTTDQDAGDAHTYTLVSGTGSTDNGAFKIVNGELRAAQSFKFAAKNTYSVRIRTTDKGGLSTEQQFSITVSEKPTITGTGNETYPFIRTAASATPSISLGYSSQLNVSGSDIVSYNWTSTTSLSSTTISNPEAKPKATTTYSVEVTNRFGSKTTVSITVTVREDYNITPNNLLTPNADGVNDTWAIENLVSYPNNKVSIFDRSGKLIYTKSSYNNDWNGQFNSANLPEGTYYYIIILNNGASEKKGFITIIN